MKKILGAILSAIGRFFGSLFAAEVDVQDNVVRISTNFQEILQTVKRETEEIRNFKFDPQWNTRVIHVPSAIEAMKNISDALFTGWHDKLQILFAPIHEFALTFRAEKAMEGFGDKPAGFVRAAVKVDEIATMIKLLANATDQIKDFTDLIAEVTHELETLDALFLQQKNPRKTEPKGHRAFRRVGKLHQRS